MKPAVRYLLLSRRDLSAAVRALFAGGEQGFWLDPSDPATAFQTSTGTTAGVVGQPLGLRLDKRLGSGFGAEQAAATYATAVGADNLTTATSATSFTQGAGTTTPRTCLNVNGTAGSSYEVIFRITAISSGTVQVILRTAPNGGGASSGNAAGLAVGTYRFILSGTGIAAAASVMWIGSAAGSTIAVDSISVREVAGNHALQATSPSRPTWAQDGAFYRDTFDGFDDSLSIVAGGGSTTGFFYCGAVHVAGVTGVPQVILTDRNGNAGYVLRRETAGTLGLHAGNGAAFTPVTTAATIGVGETRVVTLWDDGANLNVQVNQGAVASVARPVVAAGTATLIEGRASAATDFFNGSLYNRVYRAGPVPDAAQRAAVQRYIASKAGVTL